MSVIGDGNSMDDLNEVVLGVTNISTEIPGPGYAGLIFPYHETGLLNLEARG